VAGLLSTVCFYYQSFIYLPSDEIVSCLKKQY